MSRRSQRVSDLLRAGLAEILGRQMKDPRVQLATVARIDVSGDFSHAKVMVSVLGDDETRREAIEVLRKAKGFIRSQLAQRVRLRIVPQLEFELDRGAEHSQRIHQILEELHEPDP